MLLCEYEWLTKQKYSNFQKNVAILNEFDYLHKSLQSEEQRRKQPPFKRIPAKDGCLESIALHHFEICIWQ